jgi:lysophospholipase L1-like esterase
MTSSYLALGDSYTIGEQVPLFESFPYRLVQLLRNRGLPFHAPEILAKTGWTTDELASAIDIYSFLPCYDLVTLLIGVNNQYRGRSAEDFDKEFVSLLKKAIDFAGGIIPNVFVLSIPDWGITPFAAGRDEQKIAAEIDSFNAVCKKRSEELGVFFLDITTSQRLDGRQPQFLATDGLHPSGLEYVKWARALADKIK